MYPLEEVDDVPELLSVYVAEYGGTGPCELLMELLEPCEPVEVSEEVERLLVVTVDVYVAMVITVL